MIIKDYLFILSFGITLTLPLNGQAEAFMERVSFEYNNSKSMVGNALIISPNGHLLINEFYLQDSKNIYVIDSDIKKETKIIARDAYAGIAILKAEKEFTKFHNITNTIEIDFPDNLYTIIPDIGFVVGKIEPCDCSNFEKVDQLAYTFIKHNELIKCIETKGNLTDLKGNGIKYRISKDSPLPQFTGGIIRNVENYPIGLITFVSKSDTSIVASYIPFTKISNIISKMIKDGHFKRSRLHIGLNDKNGTVLIAMISDKSPTTKAGLRVGDQLNFIDEYRIDKSSDLAKILEKFETGDIVTLSIVRNGEIIRIRVVLD